MQGTEAIVDSPLASFSLAEVSDGWVPRRPMLTRDRSGRLQRNTVAQVVISIARGAMLYPFVAAPALLPGIIAGGLSHPGLWLSPVVLTMASFLCLLWAGCVAYPVVLAAHGACYALGWRPRREWFGAACGGVVGLVGGLPLWGGLAAEGAVSPLEVVVLSTAVFVGQVGGAIGGVKVMLLDRRLGVARRRGRPRFSLKQITLVVTLLSVGLAAMRLLGLLTPVVLVGLSIWAAAHLAGLYPAVLVARWRFRRLLRRRSGEARRRRDERRVAATGAA